MKNKKNLFLYSLSIIALLGTSAKAGDTGHDNSKNVGYSRYLGGYASYVPNINLAKFKAYVPSIPSVIQNLGNLFYYPNASQNASSNAQQEAPNNTNEFDNPISNTKVKVSQNELGDMVEDIYQGVQRTSSQRSKKDHLQYNLKGEITDDNESKLNLYPSRIEDFFEKTGLSDLLAFLSQEQEDFETALSDVSNQEIEDLDDAEADFYSASSDLDDSERDLYTATSDFEGVEDADIESFEDSKNTLQTIISNLNNYKPKQLNNEKQGHYYIDNKRVSFLEYELEKLINEVQTKLIKNLNSIQENYDAESMKKFYVQMNTVFQDYQDKYNDIQKKHIAQRNDAITLYNKILKAAVSGDTGYTNFLKNNIYTEADREKLKLNISLSSLQLDECIAQGNEKYKEIIPALIKKLIEDQKNKIISCKTTSAQNLFNEMFNSKNNDYISWVSTKMSENAAIFADSKAFANNNRALPKVSDHEIQLLITEALKKWDKLKAQKDNSQIQNEENILREEFENNLNYQITMRKKYIEGIILQSQTNNSKDSRTNYSEKPSFDFTKLSGKFKSAFNIKNINQTFANTWNTVRDVWKNVWIIK